MKILLTMPGLYGDIVQALLTVRAVSEHYEQSISLWISHHYASLRPLIKDQPYIEECFVDEWNLAPTGPVYTLERFEAGDQGPWRAPSPPPGGPWDKVADLQYRGWPTPTCIAEMTRNAEEDLGLEPGTLKPAVERPWIAATLEIAAQSPLVGNYRDKDPGKADFVKKLHERGGIYVAAPDEMVGVTGGVVYADWRNTVKVFAAARAVVCCQSAPWVLAQAIGHPQVLTIEPDERRHAAEFWIGAPGCRRVGWEDVR